MRKSVYPAGYPVEAKDLDLSSSERETVVKVLRLITSLSVTNHRGNKDMDVLIDYHPIQDLLKEALEANDFSGDPIVGQFIDEIDLFDYNHSIINKYVYVSCKDANEDELPF